MGVTSQGGRGSLRQALGNQDRPVSPVRVGQPRWAPDSNLFFFTARGPSSRPHRLGTSTLWTPGTSTYSIPPLGADKGGRVDSGISDPQLEGGQKPTALVLAVNTRKSLHHRLRGIRGGGQPRSHRSGGPHLPSPLKPALFDELGADDSWGRPRGAEAPAEGPSPAPQRLGVALMAVGVSSKVQEECDETSVLPGNRKGENFVFLQGSFISCLGGFSGLCNYCVIFFALPIWGGRVWPSWRGRGREGAGQEEVLVASWDPGGVIWGLGLCDLRGGGG